MTCVTELPIPKFNQCPPTKEQLDYVDLLNLDLSKFDDTANRPQLARELLDGVITHGFFTISNHGVPDELYSSQVDLAHAVLTLPAEEKKIHETSPEKDARGRYAGFKPSGALGAKGSFHKTLDHYNIPAYDPQNHTHPAILGPHMDKATELMSLIHHQVLRKLLILVAMILEVPAERILTTHASGVESTEYLRYMIYSPRSVDDNRQYRDLYLAGHTDWGSFTFQFSQPVSALQVRTLSREWKWVPHLPGALIVNVGEGLELLTGGLFKAAVHRVVKPPADQERAKRIGVVYFARPVDEQRLEPIVSPLLQRLGIHKPLDEKVYKMADYPYARKHGYKRLDFDQDRPRRESYHADPFAGVYEVPQDFEALGITS